MVVQDFITLVRAGKRREMTMMKYVLAPNFIVHFPLKRFGIEVFFGDWRTVAFFAAHASDDVSHFARTDVFGNGVDPLS